MSEPLSQAGYEQTKRKLANLEQRMARLAGQLNLRDQHRREALRSCELMIGQYRRELKLFEAAHPETTAQH